MNGGIYRLPVAMVSKGWWGGWLPGNGRWRETKRSSLVCAKETESNEEETEDIREEKGETDKRKQEDTRETKAEGEAEQQHRGTTER